MGRGEFEDILEECLSALLEGRRSVEESLSLYPAWRGRLDPLLRAAEDVAAGLDVVPPPYARERGLQRFLDAVRVRRRVRRMLSPRTAGTRWWRWGPAGLAAGIVIVSLAFMSASLIAEDGQGAGEQVSISPFTPTSAPPAARGAAKSPLEKAQEQVAALEEAIRRGQPVEAALLEALGKANSELSAELDEPGEMGLIDRVAAVSVASRQYELLQALQEQSPETQAGALQASLASAAGVLEKLGLTPVPEITPSPQPTASPTTIPSPTPSPTAVRGSATASASAAP